MNRHTIDTVTAAALRDLDPAPETDLTKAEVERADATFARIVATPSDEPVTVEPDPHRRRRWRLLVPIGLAGAAAAAIPALVLGGGSAFASWTPTPEPLTPAQTSAAAATCRAELGVPDNGEPTLLAEQRGKWTYVLISDPKSELACLMRNHFVGHDPDEVIVSYDTIPEKAPTMARDRIVETGNGQNSTDEGWFREDGWLTWTYGYVGEDVTEVTVHTPLGFDVEASVDHGRFAAWWPSDPPSHENLEVMGAWSYTVTLADGSTRRTTG